MKGLDGVASFALKGDKCCKCNTSKKRLVRHHVVYHLNEFVLLCATCHKRITIVNTIGAIITGKTKATKEGNGIRLFLWRWFLSYKGKITKSLVVKVLGIPFVFTQYQLEYIKKVERRMAK